MKKVNIILFILIIIYLIKNFYQYEEKFKQEIIFLWEDNINNTVNINNKYIQFSDFIYFDEKIPILMSPNYKKKNIKKIEDFIKYKNYKKLSKETYLENIKKTKILNNCKFNNDGLIVSNNKKYVNSSCGSKYKFNNNIDINNSLKINKGIYICGKWSNEYWHFIYEYMSSILNIEDYKEYKIIVNKKSKPVLEWLNLLDILPENIINNSYSTNKLIIPRPQNCGNPSNEILLKLRNILLTKVEIKKQNNLVLIKRTKNRFIKNNEELKKYLLNYCRLKKYNLIIHDDDNLPSIKNQLSLFSNAIIVIGPHGAGLSNIIVCKKNTKIIEYHMNETINLCYCDLTIRLGLEYIGLVAEKNKSNINKLKKFLK